MLATQTISHQVEQVHNVTINSNHVFVNFHWTFTFCVEKPYERNAPRIWRDFGSALTIQTFQTKPILPLQNEHDSQVEDQGRRQCCHNKHKKFHYWSKLYVHLLSGHALYKDADHYVGTDVL
jgi:hypothetical protein